MDTKTKSVQLPGKPFRSKHTYRQKAWGMEKGIHTNGNPMKATAATAVSDNIHFKYRLLQETKTDTT